MGDRNVWNESMVTVTTTIQGIIHRPGLYSKHCVSETVFCLREGVGG